LAAEVLDLKANPDKNARAIIIESRLDRGRGPLATVLVQSGSLKVGDNFVGGAHAGRVKAMFDEHGKKLKKIMPGFPVQVLGFDGTPQAGELFTCMDTDKETKAISLKRQALQREQAFRQIRAMSLERLSEQIRKGEARELPLIIKGDVNGSVEALSDALMKLNSDEVGVNIIHRGVGAITETDVNLAAASAALIVGFMVHPNLKSRELAAHENVEIRLYRIIYDVINDVKAALEGMLAPDISEKSVGTLEVRQTFKVPKIGTIAGCYVQAGKIERGSRIRLVRDGQQVFEGELESLKRFKDDAKEVAEGYECGVGIHNFNDIKVGDVIEVYELVETKRTLA
jgi:translation initiation factor IF-2